MFLLLCVLFTSSAFAVDATAIRRSNRLLRFIAKQTGLRDFALYYVMTDRCSRYLSFSDADNCSQSVSRTLALLDYDLVMSKTLPLLLDEKDPESFVFVAFKKELIRSLSSPDVGAYLKLVNEKLNRFMTGEGKVPANLWQITTAYFKSEKTASMILATLFQDTSNNKLHLSWLETKRIKGSGPFQENKELLARVIETINFIMDTSESHYRTIFYPPQIQKMINRNIYHFYVPLYLSQTISDEGYRKLDSAMGPLMLTLSYEFITAATDLRYLFKDPTSVTQQSLLDIYGGYSGGRFGATLPVKDFASVSEAFVTSTTKGIDSLLK